MIIEKQNLNNKLITGNGMKKMINFYYGDLKKFYVKKNNRLVSLNELSIRDFFNFVRKIPYRQDMKPIEVIARPKHLINHRNLGLDCKKKAILISSYLKSKKIPFRLVASSNRKSRKIHHVFPQAKIKNKWRNLDATYQNYKPFQKKQITNHEIL